MPIFLDTTGNSSLAIAVCDRCKMKRYYSVMRKDPNFPGLRVCDQGCADQFDPYRLAARQPERINLFHPRPDTNIALNMLGTISEDDDLFILGEEGDGYLVP